ncbi:MAG: sodium:solute symporter family protein [Methanothrix sp.]|uniref:sodium:solute symporter family protein n=1 Tax=Methanothrix sp. TaxID=90426 RepID=UPI0025D8D26B|nr:sodium:solute symporter family protein [Methanothrix sp.]MCQ8902890.1 sodium:solute symporter family protein [Methanothrix sp.]
MDPYHIFLLVLGVYISLLIGIGLISSKRQGTVTEFWLASRELGASSLGFSAAASWLTASALLLSTGLFMLIGVSSIWVWVFPNIAALALIALIAGRVKRIPAMTQPELLEIRYDPRVRAPVAVAITIMMILFSVVDFIGFKLVLGTFFGVAPLYAVLIMAVAVALYVSLGGFRAVVWTDRVQYIFLAGLAVVVAILSLKTSSDHGASLLAQSSALGSDWWNPFLMGGVLGALVFQLALLPGWIAEQDPWQRVWAARDERNARLGLLLGSMLLALVYGACFITAIALRAIYPIPEGELEAEMLYLRFISENVPAVGVALLTIGFAAASMSCTDTFATSGASCIVRDIFQRFVRPDATMREMLIISRILVVLMISISAFIALNVESIMEAVIIATVIGTTSYFFPIVGGLYWKRATAWGALAAVIVGGGTQIAMIAYEKLVLRAPLDTLSPYLTEHGVLVGLALSASVFIIVSLLTPPADERRLAPFFPDIAAKLFGGAMITVDRENSRYPLIMRMIEERDFGERAHLDLTLKVNPLKADGAQIKGELRWDQLIDDLRSRHPEWYTPTGSHIAYRLSQHDMLACVKLYRGEEMEICLSAEPRLSSRDRFRDEMYLAVEEIEESLLSMGYTTSLPA